MTDMVTTVPIPAAANGWKCDRFQLLIISQGQAVFHRLFQKLFTLVCTPDWTITVDHKLGRQAMACTDGSCRGQDRSAHYKMPNTGPLSCLKHAFPGPLLGGTGPRRKAAVCRVATPAPLETAYHLVSSLGGGQAKPTPCWHWMCAHQSFSPDCSEHSALEACRLLQMSGPYPFNDTQCVRIFQ